jgi:Zn-dependent metalloprotease
MKNVTLCILVLLSLSFSKLYSQKKIEFENIIQKNGAIQYATFKSKIASNSNEKLKLLKAITKNDNALTFEKIETQEFGKGNFQDKFQIKKNGVKLRGGELLINFDNNNLQFIHGFFADFLEEQALTEKNKILFTKNALKYFNEAVKANDEKLLSSPLIYYFNYKIEKYQLAYEVYLEAKSSIRAENVYISAINGEFLGAESKICNINFTGSAQTQYNGTQNITTDATNTTGPFILRETRGINNVIIHTRNNNFGGIEVNGATDLSDNDNNWTFAEHGNLRAGIDAHWGAETVFDYWNTVHQRNSINNAGMQINSYFNNIVLNV